VLATVVFGREGGGGMGGFGRDASYRTFVSFFDFKLQKTFSCAGWKVRSFNKCNNSSLPASN
jgi:hypothetical protein